MRRQDSNSGAKRGGPSPEPADLALDRAPRRVDRVRLPAQHRPRRAIQRRTPSVVVSLNRMSSMAAASAGRQRTVSFTPGRFFFIWMAVVYTSSTPSLPQPRRCSSRSARR